MKSIVFTTISLLALLVNCDLSACSSRTNYPDEYLLYRAYDSNYNAQDENRNENIRLWRELTSSDIPTDVLMQNVYHAPVNDLKKILDPSFEPVSCAKDEKPDAEGWNFLRQSRLFEWLCCLLPDIYGIPCHKSSISKSQNGQNLFIKWINDNKDYELAKYLILATNCQDVRSSMCDDWYYGYKEDEEHKLLGEIIDEAMAYNDKRLFDRYTLQAMRACFSLKEFDKITSLWEERKDQIPESVIKDKIRSLAAGAYYRKGEKQTAYKLYGESNDVNSLYTCLANDMKKYGKFDRMEFLFKYNEDAPEIAKYFQDEIHLYENAMNICRNHGAYKYSNLHEYRANVAKIKNMCRQAIKKGTSQKMAFWNYTLSAINAIDGNFQTAKRHIKEAERHAASPLLAESIKILDIYIDAETKPLNKAYEKALLHNLEWFDKEIVSDVKDGKFKDNDWRLNFYISLNYHNDMMRFILHKAVIKRYQAKGNNIRALQLANYANTRVLNLMGSQERHAFASPFAAMLEQVPLNEMIAYTKQLTAETDPLDRFLNNRGWRNMDFFNEQIATLSIRARKYEQAIPYLKKVNKWYEQTIPAAAYYRFDPFYVDSKLYPKNDYKLKFATKMAELEKEMKQGKDVNDRALAKIRYSLGLRNSFSRCWALTHYIYGGISTSHLEIWHNKKEVLQLLKGCDKMISDAFRMFTDDEKKAQGYLLIGFYERLKKEYAHTPTGQRVKAQCDRAKDYKKAI